MLVTLVTEEKKCF